jgi:hypothetical protein
VTAIYRCNWRNEVRLLAYSLRDKDSWLTPLFFLGLVAQLYDELPRNPDPTTSDKLSKFIFELTDTVYAFLSRAGDFGTRRVTDQLHMVYQRCLTSYQSITQLLQGEDGKSSPYVLFVQ